MSEPDDKPKPAAGPAVPSKSLFDSDWGGVLGSSPSKPSVPIFAPPKLGGAGKVDVPSLFAAPTIEPPKPAAPEPAASEPAASEPEAPEPEAPEPHEDLPAATSSPLTSDATPSVAGEYRSPEPRPEPTTPPRYEPPPGVSADYDNADEDTEDRLPIVPRTEVVRRAITEDDDELRGDELGEVIPLRANEPDAPRNPDRSSDGDRPRARAPRSSETEPAQVDAQAGGGSRVVIPILAVLAAVALIAVFATRDPDDADPPTVARKQATSEPTGDAQSPRPRTPRRNPREQAGTETDTGDVEPGETDTGGTDTGDAEQANPKRGSVDPRDPSVIPPGTPEANAKAFLKLPVSIHDGPPIGGIGSTGIHIDSVSTSRGRNNTECDQPTTSFSLGVAKYVNVCFRVVHIREQETLRVIWEKDGKVSRRGRVRIPDLHAYTTRAYLLLRPEYIGDWRVRIVPDGEETIDLAVAEFVITE